MSNLINNVIESLKLDLCDDFSIGRSNIVTDRGVALENAYFYKNNPKLFEVVGVSFDKKENKVLPRKKELTPCSKPVQGKNGSNQFEIDNGIYYATGVLGSSGRIRTGFFIKSENGFAIDFDLQEVLKAAWPGDYQLALKDKEEQEELNKIENQKLNDAQKLLVEIIEARELAQEDISKKYPEAEIAINFVFRSIPEAVDVKNKIGEIGSEETFAKYTAISGFYSKKYRFTVSEELELQQAINDAVAAKNKLDEERKIEAEKIADESKHLTKLTGSERQVQWALKIRADYIESCTNEKYVEAAKLISDSKIFIENRNDMDAYLKNRATRIINAATQKN